MISPPTGRFGLLHLLSAFHIARRQDQSFLLKRGGDEVALTVHCGIDLVGDGVFLALVFLDADVVRARARPKSLAFGNLEGRLPDAEVVALSDDLDGLGARIAVVLSTAKEVERAHGNR